jgi:putative sigma-54 modulation protein
MRTQYTARQANLTPEVRTYCEERLVGLERLLGPATDVDVILSHEKSRQKAEIHVRIKGAGLVVIEESADMLASLALAFDALEKKLKKEREKFREKKRRGGRERKELALPAEPGETEPKILRADHFASKPMSIGEAVIQFEIKKKEVFVFRMESTENWAVLYRRKDGNYGLVKPE